MVINGKMENMSEQLPLTGEKPSKHANARILGIETSCDETAAAVVENGRQILSSVVASQIDLHAILLRHIDHVEAHDQRHSQLHQFRDQI